MSWKYVLNNLKDALTDGLQTERTDLINNEPMVYWYPCSGIDLTPLVLDTGTGIEGYRLFPLQGESGSLVLWMNDKDLLSIYEILKQRDEKQLGWSTFEASLCNFRAIAELLPDTYQKTTLKVSRILPTDLESIPIEFFQVMINNTGYTGKRKRPDGGDKYLVIYSNVDSRDLIRQVFYPMKIRIKVGAIIHPGWTEPTNGPTNHYEIVPNLLVSVQTRYQIGPFLLTDQRKEFWGEEFFERTTHKVEWTGVEVVMYRTS